MVNDSFYNGSLDSPIPNTSESSDLSTETCMHIYSAAIALMITLAITRTIFFFNVCTTVSQKLHDKMFRGLIATTIRFFDTNPSGRIMNRFSKDMGSTDDILPKVMLEALQFNLLIVGVIVVTVYTNIRFLFLILVMSVAFFFLRKIFLKSSTNLKRLEATSAYTHLNNNIYALNFTIRLIDQCSMGF